MTPATWPLPGNPETALAFDAARLRRLLIVPALFDEGNRLRRFTVEVMRRLDCAGIDSLLPDLPGTNESLLPLAAQDCDLWREAMLVVARHFGATHVLGLRGGCLFTPDLPAFHYAPVKGAQILRGMLRARMLAGREAGLDENREALTAMARTEGIVLAGYAFAPALFSELEGLEPASGPPDSGPRVIAQEQIGGSGLWLRAEPDEDPSQADALAAILAEAIQP
ncbi:MAG: hypothetical protein DI555_07425 [Novosphingobium pentaromativorans]|uniref:Uncharacterized protein n=1 Tax=Novosphingobium pentaromativorans TaxID=205844 RepID=A0A2W5NUX4_9SPHN|nr:hypothetical protein [Novosphingobium panipatense]PZQ55839.1 MAG: hypothetical protein DI555_07425 [Novosphingobium pentaromativorans]